MGVFFISLSTIMLEVLFTRIISVILWYHYAFATISLALLGFSVAGLYVYLFPEKFPEEKVFERLVFSSFLFFLSIIYNLLFFLYIGSSYKFTSLHLNVLFLFLPVLAILCILIFTSFFFSGLCISLALLHLRAHISRLYFFDLIGAGLGALASVFVLNVLGGLNALLFVCALALIVSLLFCVGLEPDCLGCWLKNLKSFLKILILLFFILIVANHEVGFLSIRSHEMNEFNFTKWNALSYVGVDDRSPDFWGLSQKYEGFIPDRKNIVIDNSANTEIVGFDGNLSGVEYLRADVSNIGYHIKNNSRILIIGPGGGRDVLSALSFGNTDVTGVEINDIIVDDVMGKVYKNYSGNLYYLPGIKIHKGDGRNFISQTKDKYNFIQITLVDTWAATSAGALTLSESNLYTLEAFREYTRHLTDDGILSISRWINEPPRETLRLLTLSRTVLEEEDNSKPGDHLMLISTREPTHLSGNLTTLLLKKTRFRPDEIDTLTKVSGELDFNVLYSPLQARDSIFSKILNEADLEKIYENYPFDIKPPTDDKPFFFYTIRFDNVRMLLLENKKFTSYMNNIGLVILVSVFLIVALLVVGLMVLPLIRASKKTPFKLQKIIAITYFASIGLGFMLVEITFLQKFILFLGHPTYSLSIVLFSLLVSGGIGSYLTGLKNAEGKIKKITLAISILAASYTTILPKIFNTFLNNPLTERIIISLALITPLGILMGMPFPTAIRKLNKTDYSIIPWMWAINGGSSVLASIIAVIIAINWGFKTALMLGAIAYLSAAITSSKL